MSVGLVKLLVKVLINVSSHGNVGVGVSVGVRVLVGVIVFVGVGVGVNEVTGVPQQSSKLTLYMF
jgi:hypothetical protein